MAVNRPTIKRGSSSTYAKYIKVWQQSIGVQPADGIFGAGTEQATKNWQAAHGLVADGIVGPKTWEALDNASTPSAPVSIPTAVAQAYPQVVQAAQQGVAAAYPQVVEAYPAVAQAAQTAYGPVAQAINEAVERQNAGKPASSVMSSSSQYVSSQPQQQASIPGLSLPAISVQTPQGSLTTAPAPAPVQPWLQNPKNRQIVLFGGLGVMALLGAYMVLKPKKLPPGFQQFGYPGR